MGAGESKEKKPTPSARTVHGHGNGHGPSRWASNIWRSLKKSPRLRKKSKESQKSKKSSSDSDGSKQEQQPVQTENKNGTVPIVVPDVDEHKNMDANNNDLQSVRRRTESEVSKSEISIQLVEEENQRESPAECEREQNNNGEHFTERELLEPQAYKGNLEHDDIPTIDNSIASMSPRTFDDIPVSTVFAEEKSRENSDTRKSTTSLKSQNSRKISRESRDSKKSKKSEKSEKSENEPDEESVETAKKLKKQLEDTISELLSAATRAEQYLDDSSEKEKMSKDDFDNIHQIVGQTRLLCQDKLGKQFRNLCLKTLGEVERKNGEAAPTKMDLIGFWELVSIQVDQSKSSLKELHDKKNNDWKEIEKEKTPVTKPKKVTPKTKSTARSAPSEAQKKRDAERKARLAEMRAKTLAAKKAAEKAGADDIIIS